MALPAMLIPAAGYVGSKLATLGGAIKALGAAKAAGGVGSAMKAGASLPGVIGASAAKSAPRMAGDALFKSGIGKAVFGDMTKQQIGMRLAPDLMFGGIAGVMTPGDLGDKLIAGTTQAVGGGLGGVAVGRAAGRLGETAGFLGDMAGSMGGDMAGMVVGDAVMRGKDRLAGGLGQTPYERMSTQQQEEFVQQLRNQTLQQAGLLPGINSQYLGLGAGLDG